MEMTEAEESLRAEIETIANQQGAQVVGLAFHDYGTDRSFAHEGDRWFHAASTVKIPILVGVFAAMEQGEVDLDSRVHVRNRFHSVADGSPYRVDVQRDAGAEVHGQIGKTMKVRDLARQMITTSSNLATNLLVDLVGVEGIQKRLDALGVSGIEFRRGVEDERAYEKGINNRVTASGLVGMLRLIEEKRLSEEATREMLDILHDQEFRGGIPAGLPAGTKVANKTGEISTVAHDVGLVYLADREPYAVALLTEWDASATSGRRDALAALSRAVYRHLTRPSDV
jgi:beta-lactamase class A